MTTEFKRMIPALALALTLALPAAAHGPGDRGQGPGMMGPGMTGPGGQGPYGPPGTPGGSGARGPAWGMGPGMMMGPGWGMGPGMMGPGMMGPGWGMGPGMMMGPGWGPMMGPQMMAPYGRPGFRPSGDLGTDEVTEMLEARLAWSGNQRLKVGKVAEKDADTIVAEIVTVDDSLVARYAIDRHTGQMWLVN